MIARSIYEYLFLEDAPACVLFGFEIDDESICEHITAGIDASLYATFVLILTIMLVRLAKMTIMFVKLIEFIVNIKFIEIKKMKLLNKSKRFLLTMSKLQEYNEDYLGVWKTSKRLCKHKLKNCIICNPLHCRAVKNCNNNILKLMFIVMFEKYKLKKKKEIQLNKNNDEIKLLFRNDKYSDEYEIKKRKEMKETITKGLPYNKTNQYILRTETENATDNRSNAQLHTEIIPVIIPTTSDINSEINTSNDEGSHENHIKCKNINYAHRVVNRWPTPKYAQLIFERVYMKLLMKRIVIDNLKINKMKYSKSVAAAQIKSKPAPTNTLRTGGSYLCRNVVKKTSRNPNDRLKFEKSNLSTSKLVDETKSQATDEGDSVRAEVSAKKLEVTKRRNILKYIESLNVNGRKPIVHAHEKFFIKNANVNISSKNSTDIKCTNVIQLEESITKTRFISIPEKDITPSLKPNNTKNTIIPRKLNSTQHNENSKGINRKCQKIVSVREEIVNTLVNLPKDTLTTMKYRYKLHQTNKVKKPVNKNLDIIFENTTGMDHKD